VPDGHEGYRDEGFEWDEVIAEQAVIDGEMESWYPAIMK